MKFELIVKRKGNPNNAEWKETYFTENENIPEDLESVKQWCVEIVAFFNNTLKPGERERVLMGCMYEGERYDL